MDINISTDAVLYACAAWVLVTIVRAVARKG